MTHRQTRHGVAKKGLGSEVGEADGSNKSDDPRTYRMAFPAQAGPMPCTVVGCSGRASIRTAMRVQFWHRHVMDTVVILEQVNLTHPRCPLCDMLVPWKALNGTHRGTAQCTRCAERKRQRLAAEEEREVTARGLSAYGTPLEVVKSFRYLGRVILATDDNWTAVARILFRAREVLRMMTHILSREGATTWVSGFFFKAVVQAVLLFGSDTWVVTPHMGKDLGGCLDPGGKTVEGEAPVEDSGREVDIHLGGDGTSV